MHKRRPGNCVCVQAKCHQALLEYTASSAVPPSGGSTRQSHWPSEAHTKTKAEQQPWNWASSTCSKKATGVESSQCTVGRHLVSILFRIDNIFQIWQANLQKMIFSSLCIFVKIFNTHWNFYNCLETLRIMTNGIWEPKIQIVKVTPNIWDVFILQCGAYHC